MNIRKYFISVLVVFLCFVIIDFLFDSFILMHINSTLKNIWRPQMIFWLEPVLYLAAAFLFVLIYKISNKGRGIAEGVIYGLLIGALTAGIQSFRQYALYPLPLNLAVIWFIEGLLQYVLAGIFTALIALPEK